MTNLTASDSQAYDQFGISVAVSGDTAVVGADRVDAGGGRDAGGGSFEDVGAAYVFRRNEGGAHNWGEVKKLVASDAQASGFLGQSVAVSGDTALVGAQNDEHAGGIAAGAAYVFQVPPPTAIASDTSTPMSGAVEGTAELPDVEGTTPSSSGPGAGLVAGIGVAVVASVVVLGGAAWYARKRLAR